MVFHHVCTSFVWAFGSILKRSEQGVALKYETLHSPHGSYNRFGHRLLEEGKGFPLNYLPIMYLFKSSYLRSGHKLSIFINFAVVTKM